MFLLPQEQSVQSSLGGHPCRRSLDVKGDLTNRISKEVLKEVYVFTFQIFRLGERLGRIDGAGGSIYVVRSILAP